jgi:secreted trypsin-like serine protease
MRARGLIVLVVTGCLALAAGPAAASYQPRVLGGTPASIGHWPFIAALVEHGQSAFDGQFCGGSVIAPTVVLTAAHCVSGSSPSSIDVITGRAQLSAASTGQRLAVRAILVDPGYNANTEHHDAALLLLSAPTQSPPIALAGSADGPLLAPGAPLAVAGWGLLDNDGDAPDLLHAATVEALGIGRCQSAYGSDVTPTLMICAGTSHTDSPDACQGDSGGPLVSTLGGATRLVGLVAFGGSRCGDPGAPGVYTRVNGEIPWIARVMRSATTMHGRVPTIRTRIGHITCGSVLCTVPVTVSGDVGAVGRIVVRVSRIGAATTEQATTAARVGPHAWRARIDLPAGSLHLVALGYTKSGAPFGRAGTANIQVTAG